MRFAASVVEHALRRRSPSCTGSSGDVPRIVPPRGRIQRVFSIEQLADVALDRAVPAVAEPEDDVAVVSIPLRTIARITAFRPGASPPPVRTPMRMSQG